MGRFRPLQVDNFLCRGFGSERNCLEFGLGRGGKSRDKEGEDDGAAGLKKKRNLPGDAQVMDRNGLKGGKKAASAYGGWRFGVTNPSPIYGLLFHDPRSDRPRALESCTKEASRFRDLGFENGPFRENRGSRRLCVI